MSNYQSILDLLNKNKGNLDDYIKKNKFDSDEEYMELLKNLHFDSLEVGKYVNFTKPNNENQSDVVKYFKIWPNLPPDFFPGSIIIDLSIISRNQINDIDNLKIDILKDYGNIKKNLNFEDDDVKVLMSKIQISDIHDLFVNNKSFNIKSRCIQILICLEGYIKAMEENKDDLLKLECCKKSEGGMSYF